MWSLISFIIPTYNEEGNIRVLIDSIAKVSFDTPYEIIVVDDGSTDGTVKELELIARSNSNLRLLRMKRNFGQTAAMAAGIDHSKGDVIVPMDADGQNDPADVPSLVRKLDEGFDVVSGWRKDRKDKFFSRRLPSMIANKIISLVTGVHLHDYGCSLKAYRRSSIMGVQLYGEMHRFLPAWCVWQGGKVAEVVVRHHPRVRGQSKYGIFRTFKVMLDLVTVKFFSGFLSKPNHLFGGMGLLCVLFGFVTGLLALIDKFGPDLFPKLRIPLLLLAIFFGLSAIFLILMGLLAELLVRLYFQVRQQKPYRLINE